jgi:mono/diheme cytochrome c family protein
MQSKMSLALALGVSTLACFMALSMDLSEAHAAETVTASVDHSEAALIEKGRLLAVASDCMACHTTVTPGAKPFAGGYAIASPMGTIYSTNITPSKTAGIGDYTETQFANALREGVRADGAHLYPAMPYTSYTQLTDDDVHALYTYFMKGVAPVDTKAPQTDLPFPFNVRASMTGWNMLFLHSKRFAPDPTQSAEWNRGAYLTNVLGHCSACHTPRNTLMAEDGDRAFAGAQIGPWYAPNITSDPVSGIGAWPNADIVQYLKTGHVDGKNQAAGGMAEAVQNSLQYLSTNDLDAIAVYLKSTKPIRDPKDAQAAFSYGGAHSAEAGLRGMSPQNSNGTLSTGAALYSGSCASCHGAAGEGSQNQAYPSLFHNTATGSSNASNLIATMLNGVDRQVGDQHVLMPAFGQDSYVEPLSDDQVASIANYVLTQYGNPQVHVSAADVAVIRQGGPKPALALIQPYVVPFIVIAVMFAILVILGVLVMRQRPQKRL